jgi:hypothetical protein
MGYRSRRAFPAAASALVFLLLLSLAARAEDTPAATIKVSAAPAGGSLGGQLVRGVMSWRGRDYLLTLKGVEVPVTSVGSIRGLVRPRDIEGVFKPSEDGLRNTSDVTVVFDPPLSLEAGRLEISVLSAVQPKVSTGTPGTGGIQ